MANSGIRTSTTQLAAYLDTLTAKMLDEAISDANVTINAKPVGSSRQKSAQVSALAAVTKGRTVRMIVPKV